MLRKVSYRLYIGFAALLLLLAGAIGITMREVGDIDASSGEVSELHVPTVLAAETLASELNAADAALRGVVLNVDGARQQYGEAWAQIAAARDSMDAMAPHFIDPANSKRWGDFKALLDQFHEAQAKVLELAEPEPPHR